MLKTDFDIDALSELIPFSDNEIGVLQFFFIQYLTLKQDVLTKEQCFILGVSSANLQYNIRILKRRIHENLLDLIDEENDAFFTLLSGFQGLFVFLKEAMLQYYENLSTENKYDYHSKTKISYSYFMATEEEINKTLKMSKTFLKKYTKKWLK